MTFSASSPSLRTDLKTCPSTRFNLPRRLGLVVGTENVTNASIVDMVPVNTTYIDGSTTLNGAPVADGPNGSPLIDGLSLGDLLNDGSITTVTFDVRVYPDVPDTTIISNQAFVSAPDQGLTDLPSDDPRTELPDDPTQDIVGNYPLIYAVKTEEGNFAKFRVNEISLFPPNRQVWVDWAYQTIPEYRSF